MSVKFRCGVRLLAGLSALLFTTSSLAVCAFQTGTKTGSVTFMLTPLTSALNPSDSTPRELGRVVMSAGSLASSMGTSVDKALWSGCTGNLIWNPLRTGVSGKSPAGSGFISTGIDNLYFYLFAGKATTGSFGPFLTPDQFGAAWSRELTSIHGALPPWSVLGDVALVLYQTGPISKGGIIPAGPLAELKLSDGLQIMNMSVGAIEVNVKGCELTTSTINVGMGAVLQREFTGIGSAVRQVPFTVDTQCDSGVLPVMTFSGNQVGTDNTLFALTEGENSAKGIAVRINYSGTSVENNQILDLNRTTTQGLNSFPFSAQYVQTQSSITPGTANATLTFTLSYK